MLRTLPKYQQPGTWQSRRLSWWQNQRRKGNHIFHCSDCTEWYVLNEQQFIDAEQCCECDCGKMIGNEVLAYWQAIEVLDTNEKV